MRNKHITSVFNVGHLAYLKAKPLKVLDELKSSTLRDTLMSFGGVRVYDGPLCMSAL